MNAVMNFEDRLAVDAVKALVERHGLLRVLRVVLKAAFARRIRTRTVADLSDHLRRDIGLLPNAAGALRDYEQRGGYE